MTLTGETGLGPGLARRWATLSGLARSVRVYHLDLAHRRAMDALYGGFIRPGDLVFDIGAHVGDRVLSFRRLGASVVALEPQPGPAAVVRILTALDRRTTLVQAACGAAEGVVALRVNSRNPTISTASGAFVAAADGAPGWEGQVWDHVVSAQLTTLDALVSRFGEPAFVKIDVEGFENEVLAGLSRPIRALSFEFTTIQRDVAHAALDRLAALGDYRFDVALGETQRMVFGAPVGLAEVRRYLDGLPVSANSGDVYAFLDGAAAHPAERTPA
ncbi:hypothetical protein GCM10007036_28700 [Alsobacter metallidurans]|uniref:Methyltransferase FkbM domain-containing protein n=1 Tax=Alsobacter metallidurans TaxID=340221 RepID=A0A917MIB7_9HYPH|nr:FkbM family methyltransferase [Alsobacter metallidurans]GGH23149.1 hypothetical protein GCM10007036_28700 [Alsobacter metallidurans]